MKRTVTVILTLLLVLALPACGFLSGLGGEANDPPLTRRDGTGTNVYVHGGKSLNQPDPAGVDFGAILSGYGGTGTVWGEQSEEIRQQLIEAARANGYELAFDENGAAVLTGADGTVFKQNSSGLWLPAGDNGTEPVLGGDWPDNEYTKLIPNPGFKVLVAAAGDDSFSAVFQDVTAAQIRAYAEKLKAAGFTEEPELQDETVAGMTVYSYTASNRAGYTVSVGFTGGSATLSVSRPEE